MTAPSAVPEPKKLVTTSARQHPYQGFRFGRFGTGANEDLSKPHTTVRCGCRHSHTKGYLKFYFDGVQTASPTFYWNYWICIPAAPLPVNGSTAMSVMDQRLCISWAPHQSAYDRLFSAVWQFDAKNLANESIRFFVPPDDGCRAQNDRQVERQAQCRK